MTESTPKERYEARKAERNRMRDAKQRINDDAFPLEMLDIFDRMATSMEQIRDILDEMLIDQESKL